MFVWLCARARVCVHTLMKKYYVRVRGNLVIHMKPFSSRQIFMSNVSLRIFWLIRFAFVSIDELISCTLHAFILLHEGLLRPQRASRCSHSAPARSCCLFRRRKSYYYVRIFPPKELHFLVYRIISVIALSPKSQGGCATTMPLVKKSSFTKSVRALHLTYYSEMKANEIPLNAKAVTLYIHSSFRSDTWRMALVRIKLFHPRLRHRVQLVLGGQGAVRVNFTRPYWCIWHHRPHFKRKRNRMKQMLFSGR